MFQFRIGKLVRLRIRRPLFVCLLGFSTPFPTNFNLSPTVPQHLLFNTVQDSKLRAQQVTSFSLIETTLDTKKPRHD